MGGARLGVPKLTFAACAAALAVAAPAFAQEPSIIIGRATVIDGDTIEIRGERIRLHGIDAPESRQLCGSQPAGRRAAFALADMLGTQTVTCSSRGRDRYGRVLAVCSITGASDIGRELVRSGWAWAFVRYSRDYVADEAQAREARLGVWAWSCQAPWDWRTEMRERGRGAAQQR